MLSWKLQPLEQSHVTRVVADRVEERVALEGHEARISRLDCFCERGEGAVGIAELGLYLAILVALGVAAVGACLRVVGRRSRGVAARGAGNAPDRG